MYFHKHIWVSLDAIFCITHYIFTAYFLLIICVGINTVDESKLASSHFQKRQRNLKKLAGLYKQRVLLVYLLWSWVCVICIEENKLVVIICIMHLIIFVLDRIGELLFKI